MAAGRKSGNEGHQDSFSRGSIIFFLSHVLYIHVLFINLSLFYQYFLIFGLKFFVEAINRLKFDYKNGGNALLVCRPETSEKRFLPGAFYITSLR